MKPGIGAISCRGFVCIAIGVCVVGVARAASADDAAGVVAAPGPRPQAISPVAQDVADEVPHADVVEQSLDAESAAEPPVEAASSNRHEPTASSPGDPAHDSHHEAESTDAEQSLGLPAPPAHESLALSADVSSEPGALGSLDPRSNEVVRVIGALALVIGLILLLRAAARRLGGPLLDGGRPSGVLLVLARYPIARGQSLVLLKLGRRVIVCHPAKGAMATRCEIDSEDEVAAMLARIEAGSRGRDAARFEKMLEDFNQEHRRRAHTSRGESADIRRAMAQAPIIDLTKRAGGASNPGGGGGGGGWLRLRRAAS